MTAQTIGLKVKPLGVVHSPFRDAQGTPIQPVYARDTQFEVVLLHEYIDGLKDLAGFERVWLIYFFHRAPFPRLVVVPFRDSTERGLFATRRLAGLSPSVSLAFGCSRSAAVY